MQGGQLDFRHASMSTINGNRNTSPLPRDIRVYAARATIAA